MVVSSIGSSGYSFKHIFSAGGYQVWFLYKDDTEWYNTQVGKTPKTAIARQEFALRERGPFTWKFDGIDGLRYSVTAEFKRGDFTPTMSVVWSWVVIGTAPLPEPEPEPVSTVPVITVPPPEGRVGALSSYGSTIVFYSVVGGGSTWRAKGYYLNTATRVGTGPYSWEGDTISALGELYPNNAYMEEEVWNSLPDRNKLEIRSKVAGLVRKPYYKSYERCVGTGKGACGNYHEFLPSSILRSTDPGECILSGDFTEVPTLIPIQLIPEWGVKLAADNLPFGFTFNAKCTNEIGGAATPPATISSLPVTYSINDIEIAKLVGIPGLHYNLATYFNIWAAALTRDVEEITLKASIPAQTASGFQVQAYEKTVKIKVGAVGPEPTPTPVTPIATPTPVTPTPVTPTPSDKRRPVTCRDGSVIYQEIYVDGAWIPSGEKCPEDIAKRTMMAAVPKIMYEGQAVDIVVGAYIGAAPSTDETATLTIDNTEVSRMNTKAGEVKFRWTAEGVGMHNLCITIPANVNSPTPGRVCKTIMVSADVGSIKEQVEAEMDAYSDELELLRRKKQLSRETLRRYVPAGSIVVPATFAGETIDIGGVTRIVPPAGMTIPIDAGRHEVGVIVGGIERLVDLVVLPGAEVILQ